MYVLRMGIRLFRHFSHNFLNIFRRAIIHKSHKRGRIKKTTNPSNPKKGKSVLGLSASIRSCTIKTDIK